MFDAAEGVTALARAREALRTAERRVGVEHRDQVITTAPPDPAPLTELLPDGDLPRGAVTAVRGPQGVLGSGSLTCWLLGATQKDRWIAVVGWPELSPLAMAEAGVNVDRVALTPDAGGRAAAVIAAWVDGCEIVVAGPRAQLTPSERRRLVARARQHDTALLTPTPWEGAAMTLEVRRSGWSGPDRGERWIRDADLTVTRRSSADGAGRLFHVVRSGDEPPTVLAGGARAVRRTA